MVDLFITDPAAPRPRFTQDVDVVVQVASYGAWAALGERLRALGFREDRREGAPLCRWLIEDLVIDVMPALERVLGFTNRWYRQARTQSEERELPGRVRIRAVTAPLFLATKIEAFGSRGRGDFVASHDLEDIIAVVDGRPELADEVKRAAAPLRRFLGSTMRRWLEDRDFLTVGPGTSRVMPRARPVRPSCSRGCGRSRAGHPPGVRPGPDGAAGDSGGSDHRDQTERPLEWFQEQARKQKLEDHPAGLQSEEPGPNKL